MDSDDSLSNWIKRQRQGKARVDFHKRMQLKQARSQAEARRIQLEANMLEMGFKDVSAMKKIYNQSSTFDKRHIRAVLKNKKLGDFNGGHDVTL